MLSQTSLNGGGGMPTVGSSIGSPAMYGGTTPGMGMAQQQMAPQQPSGINSMQPQFGMKPAMPQQQYSPNIGGGMTGGGAALGGYGGQGGGARPISSAASSSPFGSRGRNSSLRGGSLYNGRGRKKPSKKSLLAILLFICAVVFVLLGD